MEDLLQLSRGGKGAIDYTAAIIAQLAADKFSDEDIAIFLNMEYGRNSNYGSCWSAKSVEKLMRKNGHTYVNSKKESTDFSQSSTFLGRMNQLIARGYDTRHIANYLNKLPGESGWTASKVWDFIEANNLSICSTTQ